MGTAVATRLVAVLILILSESHVCVPAKPRARPNTMLHTHLEPRPRYLRVCPGIPAAVLGLDVKYRMEGRTSVVLDIDMAFSRTDKEYKKTLMTVEKCVEAVSSNTCSPFKQFVLEHTCPMMMSPLMPWSPAVSSVQPKVDCPLKAGNYSLRNGTLGMDVILAAGRGVRLEGSVWRTRSEILNERGKHFLCFETAFEFLRVRNRPRRPTTTATTTAHEGLANRVVVRTKQRPNLI